MNNERIVWAQENVESKFPEVWRDISVPKVRSGIPPIQHNVTIAEWGDLLRKNKMVGVYRAYTDHQRIVAIIVTIDKIYTWRAEDITHK